MQLASLQLLYLFEGTALPMERARCVKALDFAAAYLAQVAPVFHHKAQGSLGHQWQAPLLLQLQ